MSGIERAAIHQAPTIPYPPTKLPTTAVQQLCSSTYRPIYVSKAEQQQCSSTHHNSALCTRVRGEPGGDFHFLTILRLPGKRGGASPGKTFQAPRSPSAAISPGTPRVDVWGGRGTSVSSLGGGWHAIERVVRNEY